MRRCFSPIRLALALLVLPAAVGAQSAKDAGGPTRAVTAFGIDSAVLRLGATPLWPRFEPLRTPLAIFDGNASFLFRHPSPPATYSSLSRQQGVWALPGRDPLIEANSSAPLGGVSTATVILNPASPYDTDEWAALTLHEIFHVFQRARHPAWAANEVDLFTYAMEDTAALALRREESATLSRALVATSDDMTRCWAHQFMWARRGRFARLGPASAEYERATELKEGLAQYVESRALGRAAVIPPGDFPVEQVRQRGYAIGAALGQVLDRLRPDWRETLELSSTPRSLDDLLEQTLGAGGPTVPCGATGEDRSRWAAAAGRDVHALRAQRVRTQTEFLRQPGWQLVVEAAATPLFPQGFDPLNVQRLAPSEVLHTRFVRLGNAKGTVATFGRTALTEGVGPHPLFNGIRRVTITGLAAAPIVRDSSGVLVVHGAGIDAQLRGAHADTAGTMVRVSMP